MANEDSLKIRFIQEASNRWAARTDVHPNVVGYGASQAEAKEDLLRKLGRG